VTVNWIARHQLWSLVCLLIAGVVALPTLMVVVSVFQSSDGEWAHLADTRLPRYVQNTAVLAVGVGLLTVLIGTATAWLVTTCDFPGRSVCHWALLLPLAVPSYLAAYAYTDLLQFSGPVQSWLRETFGWGRKDYWFPPVRSAAGAIFVLTLTLYPYVYLAARTAFIDQAGRALEVGRTLGRGPWAGFLSLSLPLARPSIAAGGALVLMETLADFGTVDYFAVDTFATGVYRTWRSLESPVAASQLAAVLLGVVSVVVLVELVARRRARHFQPGQRALPVHRVRLRGGRAWASAAVCFAPVLLGFVLPAGVFLHLTGTAGDPQAARVVGEFGANSLQLAAAASLIAATLALLVGYGRRLGRGPLSFVAGKFAGLGYALPGTVVAIGLLTPLSWLDHRLNDVLVAAFGWQPGLVLTGSVVAVVFGYQTRFLGVALAMLDASFQRIRPSMDDAARTLGASTPRLMFRVHLPLLRVSLLAAVLLVFVDVVKELPATLMLRPFNFDTLAVRVYQLASDERLDQAAFGALVIIGVGLIPVAVLSRLLDRSAGQTKIDNLDEAAMQ
jgi:iron(III) transport system permease protein